MADAKHTPSLIPAPWSVDRDDRPGMGYNNHILAANGNTVCFMAWSGDHVDNSSHKNAARLIAAAPDLLAELKAARDFLFAVGFTRQDTFTDKQKVLFDKVLSAADATIAKATGAA